MSNNQSETPKYVIPLQSDATPLLTEENKKSPPLDTEENKKFPIISERNRSILVLGETGSGKTEAIKLLSHQFAPNPEDPIVVFDYKNDYSDFFSDRNYSRGRELLSVSLDSPDMKWNIFDEASPPKDKDFEEIGRALFTKYENKSNNPFFPKSARQVFIAVLKQLQQINCLHANNQMLMKVLDAPVEGVYKFLGDDDGDRDEWSKAYNRENAELFRRERSLIDPDVKKQSKGVIGNLHLVTRDLFKRGFALDPRDDNEDDSDVDSDGSGPPENTNPPNSVRSYMDEPNGRILHLNFPIDASESVKPVYKFYIDWAIRHGLQNDSTTSYFILDEFQTIPNLEMIERLVNAGRAQNAYAIIGLQSVGQLQATYGEAMSKSILSGLTQEILLRPGDQETVEYIRSRVGRQVEKTEKRELPSKYERENRERRKQAEEDLNRAENTDRPEPRYTIERKNDMYPKKVAGSKLLQMNAGEAIIIRPDEEPVRGRLCMLTSDIEDAKQKHDFIHYKQI